MAGDLPCPRARGDLSNAYFLDPARAAQELDGVIVDLTRIQEQ